MDHSWKNTFGKVCFFKVELAIFNEIGDANDHKYRSRVRSRVANLTRNPAIGKQILDGVISPEKVDVILYM